jgi:hypothetical protein
MAPWSVPSLTMAWWRAEACYNFPGSPAIQVGTLRSPLRSCSPVVVT